MRRAAVILSALAAALPGLHAASIDVPFFRQSPDGCGAASVGMVVAYWSAKAGLPAEDPERIYERLHDPEAGGVALATMKTYFADAGYHVFTVRGELKDLDRQIAKQRPVIVGLRDGRLLHFAVVSGIDSDRVRLHDPAKRAPRTMKRKKFERKWAGAESWMLLAAPRGRDERASE